MQSATTTIRRPIVLGDLLPGEWVRDVLVVAGFAGFIGLMAQASIRLPFTPVPITGQTFAVLLGAMACGPRRALAGSSLYLLVGLIGVPWFAAGSAGWTAATIPTFGYIAGFVLASAVVGQLAARGWDRRPHTVIAAMVIGNLAIYLVGATWLAADLHLSAAQAISLGVTPFLLGDALKAIVAAGLLPTAWRLVGRQATKAQ